MAKNNKKIQEQLEQEILEEKWYDEHLEELLKAYKEELEKYNIETTIINFIKNKFNGCKKYISGVEGHEIGRTYYKLIEIKNYDVNKVYDEWSYNDSFLKQVLNGGNTNWNYQTFHDELEEIIDEDLYELVGITCRKFSENENILYFLDEETCDLRGEFKDELLYRVNWEDLKKYVR